MEEKAKRCAKLIKESKYILALSGAGISTNAGIPDFRGPNGIYTTGKYDADKVFDINYFLQDPKPFYDFTRDFIEEQEKKRKNAMQMSLLKSSSERAKKYWWLMISRSKETLRPCC